VRRDGLRAARFEYFAEKTPYRLVHQHCAGSTPVRVEAVFDEPWRGKPLSDHDGLLVVYRLSWSVRSSLGPPLVPVCGRSRTS
jgi:hypothetical protein